MSTDVAIIGGGIAGLWLLNRLRLLGYDAHLYEKTALGAGQTIACQGIVHGGLKYAINSILPPVASSLRAMPKRWTNCLNGKGEIDLMSVKVLSYKHELRLQNRMVSLPLWSFPEPVIDIKSLLTTLRDNCQGFVHLGAPRPAQATIFTAGTGNEYQGTACQRRPLKMFMVKPNPFGAPVYLHWMGRKNKPVMTVTTHYLGDEQVLYLGGNVAEKAVGMSDDAALFWAYTEIQYRFPGIPWHKEQWAIHDVDRAEPENGNTLPEKQRISTQGNRAIAWPVKMALAPVLADELIAWLASIGLRPSKETTVVDLPTPPIAPYPWETSTWR